MTENNLIDQDNLYIQIIDKIKLGEHLIEATKKYEHIDGLGKLQRKIKQELTFLKKIYKTGTAKKEHLQCSNLTHFTALINKLKEVDIAGCKYICQVFMLEDRKITVDIVCNNGLSWIKVIARNPKSLSQISMGDAGYGVRSILDQAEEFMQCADFYPCLFQTPSITFTFANGIAQDLAEKIESLGINVEGERLLDIKVVNFLPEDDDDDDDDDTIIRNTGNNNNLTTQNISKIRKLNIDVSAMLAYCSSVTNGSAQLYDFSVHVLAQQAEWERQRPQKPILDNFFKGKKLYCCETARDNFINIVKTVGGPNEKIRAEEFLKRLIVLPDNAAAADAIEGDIENNEIFQNVQFTSDKTLALKGKIRERSLIIFTFGDRIQAVTVTANDGFVRSAKQQGINFVVFVHESRALTEQKEQTKATMIDGNGSNITE